MQPVPPTPRYTHPVSRATIWLALPALHVPKEHINPAPELVLVPTALTAMPPPPPHQPVPHLPPVAMYLPVPHGHFLTQPAVAVNTIHQTVITIKNPPNGGIF